MPTLKVGLNTGECKSHLIKMSGDSTFCYTGDENFVIENGILKGLEVPYLTDYDSYGEFILDRLKANRNYVGQINGLTGKEETFAEMMEKSVKCAMWLKEQNVQPGDVVAICSDNRMDAYVPPLASLYIGAIFNAWWDAALTKEVTRHFLNLTKPKVLFSNEASAALALEVAKEIGMDLKVVILGKLPGLLSMDDILATQDGKNVADFRCTKLSSIDAPAVLIYTSGTTGMPKAALHSHRGLFGNLNITKDLGALSDDNVVTIMLFSSLSWVTGIICMLKAICGRERKVVYPEFQEETALQLIDKFKVNWLFLGTSGCVRILKCPSIKNYDLSSLQFICTGGAAFKGETQKALAALLPQTSVLQAYGATEMGGLTAQQTADYKPSSCGKVVKNMKMKVIDPETEAILGPNETGEACLKSDFMMSGYYKNPEATSKAIDAQGWYHTGDLVHYDEEGNIFVTDRMKEMIKYRGHHVSPAMVEQVLQNHPGVLEVAVLGVPNEMDDEHAMAFITKTSNSNVTKEELLKLVEDALPDYMKLRGGVMFLDELPHTSSGKIARSKLRNLAKSYAH